MDLAANSKRLVFYATQPGEVKAVDAQTERSKPKREHNVLAITADHPRLGVRFPLGDIYGQNLTIGAISTSRAHTTCASI